MSPTKPGTKPKRKLSDRQKALRESMALFKKTKLTPDGRKRVKEIFAMTTGKYITQRRGKHVWKGKLRKFVLSCTRKIAENLAATTARNGVSSKEVQVASVASMKAYARYSGPCKEMMRYPKKVVRPQGDVCGSFLDQQA